jgi:hypothetical protein
LNKNQAARDAYASLIDESDLTPEEKNKYYAELAEYTKRKSSEFKKSSDNFNITLANNPGLASHPALLIPIALGTYFGPSILEALRASSPIILDLDGDGVETISLSEGVYFDHDGNAFAEKSGWVGKDDGLLVLDINQDGQIDSGRELFGNNTYLNDGTLAKNGYLALQELDDDHNGIIDSADAIWQQLNVWQDKNSNGKVDSGELLSLDSMRISSITTGYTNSTVIDDNGNTHQQDSSFTFNDGTRGASSAENARFSKHYSDLIIQAYGADDSVTLSNYFSSNGDRYFNFAFDDKILTLSEIAVSDAGHPSLYSQFPHA